MSIYQSLIAHLAAINFATGLEAVGLVLTTTVAFFIAARSRQLSRPKLRISIGESASRGDIDDRTPVKHIMWLARDSLVGGDFSISFVLTNASKITVQDIQVSIAFRSSAYISNEKFLELVPAPRKSEAARNPIFQSRDADIQIPFARVEYKLDSLHPNTSIGWMEPMLWSQIRYAEDNEALFGGTGFSNVIDRIRALKEFRYHDVVAITYSGENLAPRTEFVNVVIMGCPEHIIGELSKGVDLDNYGNRMKRRRASEIPQGDYLRELTERYRCCFWMRVPQWTFPPPPAPPMIRMEKLELVPMVGAANWSKNQKRLARDMDISDSEFMVGTSVLTTRIMLPWRNYFQFPRSVNSLLRILLYQYGITLPLRRK